MAIYGRTDPKNLKCSFLAKVCLIGAQMKALGLKRTMPLEFLRSEPIWRSYGPKTICPYMGVGTENGLLLAVKWAKSKIFNSNLHYIINRHEIQHIVEFQPQSCPNNDFRAKKHPKMGKIANISKSNLRFRPNETTKNGTHPSLFNILTWNLVCGFRTVFPG